MASGSQSMTTYYAKRIVGDASAAQANSALLQTGANVTADTWILNRTNRADIYGIKYVYDTTTTTVHNDENDEDITTNNGHDKVEFYGGSVTASAWVQLDTGDITAHKFIGALEGNADTATIWQTARTLTIGNTGKSVNGSEDIEWTKNEILGASTSAYFLRGDKEWSNTLTGEFITNGDIKANKGRIWAYYDGESYFRARNNNTSVDILLDSDTNGNHGIWSTGWWNGSAYTEAGKWMIYRDTAGVVWVNGYAQGVSQTSITSLSDFIHASNLIYSSVGGSNSITDKPSGVDAFGVLSYKTALGWYGQILTASNTGTGIYWRTGTTLSGSWKKILDSDNYNDYTPTKTGGGASGTWGISITGNAATATKLSNTPNNTTTFLRGDNTWTNTLTGTFYSSGSPGFQNVTAAGTWAYLQLKSGTLGWDIAVNSSQNSGALDFRPHKSTNKGIMISQDGGLYFRNPATDGIYYTGTKATHRMIRFIDNASDTYGNGIGIGGGGLVVIGAGESSDTLLSNLSLTSSSGTETTYVTSDGSIEFYPSINGWDATARIWMTAGVLNIGLDGNSPRENSLNVYGGAGRIQLYSASSTTGNRGLWVPAHGSGSAKNIILVDTNNNITFNGNVTGNCSGSSGSCTGNAATCTYPLGFSSRSTNATWGNQTGTTITAWSDSAGGSCDWRMNNPSSGKMSLKVDGRFYGNEGTYPTMLMRNENSYWGLCDPDAANNVWIRTTTQGIIPFQSGGRGAGHCGLGTSSWYFSYAYVDTYYANKYSTTHGYINGAATNGGIDMILAGDDVWLGDCNAGGILGLKAANSTNCGLYFYNNSGTAIGQLYSANGSYFYTNKCFYTPNTGSSWIDGQRYQRAALNVHTINNTGSYFPWVNQINDGSKKWFSFGILNNSFYWIGSANTRTANGYDYGLCFDISTGYLSGATRVYSAIWNDYAEFRVAESEDPGCVVIPSNDGIARLATSRLQPGGRVISDTYGHAVGQSDQAKTPIGLAGRVLAYPYRNKGEYKIGDAVCSAPGGTIDIMTREEIMTYPDRIIGIVNEIPDYEVWEQTLTNQNGGGKTIQKIEVKGRIWIDIK